MPLLCPAVLLSGTSIEAGAVEVFSIDVASENCRCPTVFLDVNL